jgi:predicted phage-related endonuclease
MNIEKYNGFTNRSTWLAVLHLNNTSEQVYKRAVDLSKKYHEMIKYWDTLKRVDSSSYSYPFHQHKAIENGLKMLLKETTISGEADYRFRSIDYKEVFNAIN